MNGNFTNLKTALEAAQASNNDLRNEVRDLKAALANLLAINSALSVETVNGVRTLRLSGVNLQVVNGTRQHRKHQRRRQRDHRL